MNFKKQDKKMDTILKLVLYTQQTPDDLLHQKVLGQWKEKDIMKKRNHYKKIAIAAAFAICLIGSNFISYAATGSSWIQKTLQLGNGASIEIDNSQEQTSVSVDGDYGLEQYILIHDDRMYFIINDEKIDITDQCSSEEYFQYDYAAADGTKHVIFAGGTIEEAGWAEFIFDSDGTYLTNIMHIDGNASPAWLINAEISIDVPTGNTAIDFK